MPERKTDTAKQDGTLEQKQASRVALAMVRETTPLPRLRIWLETADGDETSDRDGNGIIDSIQDTDDLVAALGLDAHHAGEERVLHQGPDRQGVSQGDQDQGHGRLHEHLTRDGRAAASGRRPR